MVAAAFVLAGACSGSPEAPTAGRATFRTIAPDTSAMIFDPATARAEVEAAARAHCTGKQWCKVLGWSDPGAAATAMPLTDREVAAQRFGYTLNRSSGMDEFRWQ